MSDPSTDPLTTEGHRLAVALTVATLRDDVAGAGMLLAPFPDSVERRALGFAAQLLAGQIKYNAAHTGTPMDEVIKVLGAGLLGLG